MVPSLEYGKLYATRAAGNGVVGLPVACCRQQWRRWWKRHPLAAKDAAGRSCGRGRSRVETSTQSGADQHFAEVGTNVSPSPKVWSASPVTSVLTVMNTAEKAPTMMVLVVMVVHRSAGNLR